MGDIETKNYCSDMSFFFHSIAVCILALGVAITSRQKLTTLHFHIVQDQRVYDQSLYGEPPQVAIWIEDKISGDIRTVFVTRRTATGNFEGKSGVHVALPAWIGYFRKESGRTDFPTPLIPADVTISGPSRYWR